VTRQRNQTNRVKPTKGNQLSGFGIGVKGIGDKGQLLIGGQKVDIHPLWVVGEGWIGKLIEAGGSDGGHHRLNGFSGFSFQAKCYSRWSTLAARGVYASSVGGLLYGKSIIGFKLSC
jgi:hypothetical protein